MVERLRLQVKCLWPEVKKQEETQLSRVRVACEDHQEREQAGESRCGDCR